MNDSQLLATSVIGAAAGAAVAAWSLRSTIRAAHQSEVDWWRRAADRLSPTTANAEQHAALFYAGVAAAWLAALVCAPYPWMSLLVVGAWPLRSAVADAMWRQRRKALERQLPDAIRSVAAAFSAGCSLPQAIARAADSAPEPIRTELRVMSNRYRLGTDLRRTIEASRERIGLPDFGLFASAVLVGREMGGDVGQVLSRISRAVENVHAMRGKVRASTAAGRATLKCLYAAPFLFIAMSYVLDPDAVGLLFRSPLGWLVLGVGLGIAWLGIVWAKQIVNVEV